MTPQPERPPKDRARLALPTDAFVDTESATREHAEDVLISICMRDGGLSWPVPAYDVAPNGNASWNPAGRLLFTASTAVRFGYHQQIGRGGLSDTQIAALFSPPEEAPMARERREACLRRAQTTLGAPPAPLATELALDAYDAMLLDPLVVMAAERWHSCMAPARVADLPAGPTGMPSDSVQKLAGLDRDDVPPTERPTPEERRIAVWDARCRESSGYAATAYDAEYDRQALLVDENVRELRVVRGHLDALHRCVEAVLRQSES